HCRRRYFPWGCFRYFGWEWELRRPATEKRGLPFGYDDSAVPCPLAKLIRPINLSETLMGDQWANPCLLCWECPCSPVKNAIRFPHGGGEWTSRCSGRFLS